MSDDTIHLKRRQALKVLAGSMGLGVLGAAGVLGWRRSQTVTVYQETRSILGTLITIRIHHTDARVAAQAAGAAFAVIGDVDRVMSIHRSDSDLSRVNCLAGSESVRVSPMLTDILQLAGRIHDLSGGAYDVTCLPVMRLYGFYNSGSHHLPTDREVLQVLDAVGERHVTIDAARHDVGLHRSGGGIDLGSIGKGYAVDLAADSLRAHGIRNALIDAGGNILAMGAASETESGWSVAIRNPSHPDAYFETITLHDEGVATSGNYEQSVVLDGRRIGHLFDLRTGRPSDGRLSTSVVAKSAALSDALSTTLFVLGPSAPESLTRLARHVYHHTVTG
jgi:thiamine biosynthesis lipoprotein